MSDKIGTYHAELLKTMGIPKWMLLKCPYCDVVLPETSVRTIGLKLNTRNIGDITLEILCDKCGRMDTLYFRREISKIADFGAFLTGEKTPKSSPLLEEDMYEANYNNLLESPICMASRENGKESKLSMIKRGSCSTEKILVSSSVYVCSSCDHTEIVKNAEPIKEKLCPKCNSKMKYISASAGVE